MVDIIPTHNRLRDNQNLIFFINRFMQGKGYLEREKPCHICRVEGKLFLTDGHHESVAAYLTNCFDISRYFIEDFALSQMLEINYPAWITPFNPHTECRKPDYWAFKEELIRSNSYGRCPKCNKPGVSRERRINGNDICEIGHSYPSKDSVTVVNIDEVLSKSSLYKEPRTIGSIGELAVKEINANIYKVLHE